LADVFHKTNCFNILYFVFNCFSFSFNKIEEIKKEIMIKYDLNDRVAVVTGGAQGFGLAITERFIEAGAKVIIWDIDENAAKEAINKIKSVNLSHQVVDVTNFEIVNKNLAEVEKKYGKIDIFVNNAGIAGMNTTVAEYPLDEWKKVMNLNLNSVFYCCKAVVPFMLKNDYGRIVNIASIAGKEGNPNASAYSTSKAGVIGLTKSLGKELAQKNIAVNCVTPAAAKTRIFDQMTEEHINYMLSKIPRNKFAKVEELASLVTWLASEENSFSTAAVFDLSGGRATY
jgi:NAD(P)-dependent dehydrogenase (short-subunit alcohol dehydrogenase family)